jgi:hypothetical protein
MTIDTFFLLSYLFGQLSFSRMVRSLGYAPIHPSLKEVALRADHKVLAEDEADTACTDCLRSMRYFRGEGKTTYTFSISVKAFSVEFPLACYHQAGRVWYVSGALRRTYMLFYPHPYFRPGAQASPSPLVREYHFQV